MTIQYAVNKPITCDQFLSILESSKLGERRPTDDIKCLKGMIENSNLLVTAWKNDTLIGIARCMTDFHYACYLSDLAVDQAYQNQGIGKKLQELVKGELQKTCKLILISAPAANNYYEHIGFTLNPRCWVLEGKQTIK